MTCKVCKFYKFEQNDMLGACKRYPTVVNKSPTDWCGEEIPAEYEAKIVPDAPLETQFVYNETQAQYDINTDEVKTKGKRKNAREQK